MKHTFTSLGIVATALLIGFPGTGYANPGGIENKSQVIAQNSNDFNTLAQRCNNSSGQEALEACERALRIKEDEPSLWVNYGAELAAAGDKEKALGAFANALKLREDYSLVYYNVCVIFSQMGEYTKSANTCAKAIQVDANWGEANKAQAFNNLGVALVELRRYEQALGAYEEALKISPNYTLAQQNRDSLRNYLQGR